MERSMVQSRVDAVIFFFSVAHPIVSIALYSLRLFLFLSNYDV